MREMKIREREIWSTAGFKNVLLGSDSIKVETLAALFSLFVVATLLMRNHMSQLRVRNNAKFTPFNVHRRLRCSSINRNFFGQVGVCGVQVPLVVCIKKSVLNTVQFFFGGGAFVIHDAFIGPILAKIADSQL